MNIQRKNSAHHFRMQSEREQTLVHSTPPPHTTDQNVNKVGAANALFFSSIYLEV